MLGIAIAFGNDIVNPRVVRLIRQRSEENRQYHPVPIQPSGAALQIAPWSEARGLNPWQIRHSERPQIRGPLPLVTARYVIARYFEEFTEPRRYGAVAPIFSHSDCLTVLPNL
jgi:hypothetical protein